MKRPSFGMIILIVAAVGVFISAVLFYNPSQAYALLGITPFGGRVIASIPCGCDPGFSMVTVGPPRGGTFIKSPVTRVYQYRKVSSRKWVLGIAAGMFVCRVPTPDGCETVGKGSIMIKVGTSN